MSFFGGVEFLLAPFWVRQISFKMKISKKHVISLMLNSFLTSKIFFSRLAHAEAANTDSNIKFLNKDMLYEFPLVFVVPELIFDLRTT